uniref:Sec-independent protein translocase protein TATA, chloroplastic n=1 Tax=Ananas comosus var. bracteatus TaxID=296719 RepID=A0A6V7PB45_ANACO|nr:unnamed protein product [Ananas comosus var. bracteatus]
MAIACSSTALMAAPPLLRTKPSFPSTYCYGSLTPPPPSPRAPPSSSPAAAVSSVPLRGGAAPVDAEAEGELWGRGASSGSASRARRHRRVAALVFGPKKLPEIGRSIGKTVKSFQQAAKEFETEIKKDSEDASQPAPSETSKTIKSEDEKKELEASSGTKESI